MEPYERRFVRPSLLQLVDALDEAARRVNAGGARIDIDRDGWEASLAGIRGCPEGLRQWPSDAGPAVRLAWWTDAAQRRHFLVRASTAADEAFEREADVRPPVWHLFPEAVFGRSSCGEGGYRGPWRWLTVCSCGLAGRPEEMGWMGSCCKACFDRAGEAPQKKATAGVFRLGRAVDYLAFSAGGLLAAAGGRGRVDVWDLGTQTCCGEVKVGPRALWDMAWGPEGEQLYLSCQDRALRIVRWPGGETVQELPTPSGPVRLAIAPDGLTLALVAKQNVEIWARDDVADLWTFDHELRDTDSIAFSPDGQLFVRGGCVYLYLVRKDPVDRDWVSCQGALWRGPTCRFLAFQPGGKAIVADGVGIVSAIALPPIQELGSPTAHWHVTPGMRPDLKAGLLSPDTQWLAAADGPGPRLTHLTDVEQTFSLRGRPTAAVVSLAFSHGGDTLATGHADGSVQLWPWRRLVGA